MRTNYSLRYFLRISFLFIVFLNLHSSLMAQAGSLDANALAKLMAQNQKSGLSPFHGIYEQYNITFDNADVAGKYQQQLVSGIKNIGGVIDCNIQPQNLLLTVKFPKESEKQNGTGHIAEIKALMDAYHLRMTDCKSATYHN